VQHRALLRRLGAAAPEFPEQPVPCQRLAWRLLLCPAELASREWQESRARRPAALASQVLRASCPKADSAAAPQEQQALPTARETGQLARR